MFDIRLKSHHNAGGLVDKYVKKERLDKSAFLEVLDSKGNKLNKVMYIHIPFCDKICSFCNLNRTQLDNDLEDYTNYLLSELDKLSETRYIKEGIIEVIYFGGGTPTILKEHQLEKILKVIRDKYNLHTEYEWTLETTLHNLTKAKVEVLNRYGVNRLSVGIQTFSDEGRKYLNRTYDKVEVSNRIKSLREKFGGLVCADIIYNYPKQSIEEVREDAKLVKELDFDSVSFYSLMIHQGSELSKEEIELSNTKRDFEYFQTFYNELIEDPEWELMELTKFLRKGRDKYKYIGLRNTGAETLPVGIGAGGGIGELSIFNMKSGMSFYLKQTSYHIKYGRLGGLLQFSSYDLITIKKLIGAEAYNTFIACLDEFVNLGYGSYKGEVFSLSKEGVFWGNNISRYICEKLIEGEFNND